MGGYGSAEPEIWICGETCPGFLETLNEVQRELQDMAAEDGRYVATEHLRKRVCQITKMDVQLIHEDEMRLARQENEAKGIYFPEDDQDIKEWW